MKFVHMSKIERQHLAIVRAVEEYGSLTAAADHLHLSQSALSHAVRKLEDQLGVALWHREGRRLRLTQAGRYLLGEANRLLPQFERAETRLAQYAEGERGTLRIGMECHPCYQWLLTVVGPYLAAWPDVDVDVRQKFQFGGLQALFDHEIDVLVTPDPLPRPGLKFTAVFDYEQVLVVARDHPLATRDWLRPADLANEVLITYPVEMGRLDIFNRFLQPAGVFPRRHKHTETTDIMLQMVASGRGVAALPRWLVAEYEASLPVVAVTLGKAGIDKQIWLGVRDAEASLDYLAAFIAAAAESGDAEA